MSHKTKVKDKLTSLWKEFKKFISKGNVVDMAIGVIIGSSFSAIVKALADGILMPIITCAVPQGGIDGLVTVLNPEAAKVGADFTGKTVMYWGETYNAQVVNIINWGAFINALIYFLMVAIVLFTILKVFTTLKQARLKLKAKEQEKYFERHPEERPKPVEPGKPKPTELDVLLEIRDSLKEKPVQENKVSE